MRSTPLLFVDVNLDDSNRASKDGELWDFCNLELCCTESTYLIMDDDVTNKESSDEADVVTRTDNSSLAQVAVNLLDLLSTVLGAIRAREGGSSRESALMQGMTGPPYRRGIKITNITSGLDVFCSSEESQRQAHAENRAGVVERGGHPLLATPGLRYDRTLRSALSFSKWGCMGETWECGRGPLFPVSTVLFQEPCTAALRSQALSMGHVAIV
ncbi:hypothetical protein BS47DRAFT_1391937 [Hydnum rufescens UP504]|uniref:Uncharacterized protein n=1 Tax=Hydnum rufescens UP504 TaxID=1448309 RepID=A0A9P6AZR8_9AGAM|nr:hypothetical protein BS47DRAFT_1391937 [Hydnum rufescens UP504]